MTIEGLRAAAKSVQKLIDEEEMMRARIMSIGPTEATGILLDADYPMQRAIRRKQVNLYTAQMIAGRWHEGGSLTFVCGEQRRWLIDGYHRLNAVIESQTTQNFVVIEHDG